jgi:phospholipid/cholesterol/gamma-HCH transport system substrate-binding protein
MKSISAGVKVAVLFLLMTGGSYAVWKNLSNDATGGNGYPLFARFRDASGLPVGSKVVIAGLPVGQVTSLSIDGRYARVVFRVRNDVKIWDSATVVKKSKSLLGDHYLEIDPGSAETVAPDGSKAPHTLLIADNQVPRVIEATSPDALMHQSEETLTKVDNVLLSMKDLSDDVRRIVNGPLSSVASRVDSLIQKESGNVSDILERANRTMGRIEAITGDIRSLTQNADGRVLKILDNLDAAAGEAKVLVASAKSELELTGAAVRGKLDRLDQAIENSTSITKKIDSNQGTLGRLVNDPAIADNVEDITDGAKGFLGTLFGMKTYVGLRSEYNVFAGLARHYVSIELHTRPDKFYLVEFEQGPRGGYPTTTLEFDPTVDPNNWIRKSVIEDKFRFSFQFAKRFGWLTLRYGVKESSGGVGADADYQWWGHGLKLSLDVFDASFDRYPRVKLAAAVEVFRHLYILGGVDELLNRGGTLPIVSGNTLVPSQFESLHYGRDVFLGGMLRFNDEDLSALLTIGGSALSSSTKR